MRVAIVTGGTRGIGKAISIALADAGARTAATYAHVDSDAELLARIGLISAFKWDVSDLGACLEGVARVEAEIGPVDILVNNISFEHDMPFIDEKFDNWKSSIGINLGSYFNMAKATFPGMCERGWGRIVNIGSIDGQAGQRCRVCYSSAKSAIQGFTKALALEGARFGVTVNMIAPGYIRSETKDSAASHESSEIVAAIPVGRLGESAEVARGVCFLCAEEAGFITGSTLSINGGQHMY